MSELPCGWVSTTLGEIATFEMGQAPAGSASNFDGIGTIFVKAGEFGVLHPVIREWTTEPKKFSKAGDILICVVGATSGKLNLGIDCAIGRSVAAIRPVSGISQKSIYYQLLPRVESLRANSTGSAQGVISQADLAKLDVLLPPHAEQARIVEKLEPLLADLDAGVAELKAAQRKLAQYRQSLLKAAVEGALTADWRAAHAPQETGAELLTRILRERRARFEQKHGSKKTYKEPVAPDTSQLPALPDGWVWATIEQFASVGTGVTPLRSNRSYFDSGTIPWITSGALNEEIVTSASEYVTERAISECRLELYPAGSLLVAMYGEGKTRGKCAQLAFPSTINQAIAALVFDGSAISVRPHVKTFLLDAYEAMRKKASGGVQPNLNLQIIKALPVPLPPLSEQHQILTQLDTALSACKEQESAIAHALKQAAAQRRNLLRAAFSGQLVPQDLADEPASVLLTRIRVARASSQSDRFKAGRMKRSTPC